MNAMERMRAGLREKADKKANSNKPRTGGGDGATYPFWNMKPGQSATVRFLADADPDNAFFWVERQQIKLPFSGVVGGEYPTDGEVEVTVPCVDMWQERSCPIIQHIRSWWKTPKESLAREYYKKRKFLFHGFVVKSPFTEENLPENPIRKFVIGPQIIGSIEQSLMDSEMPDMPTDPVGGRDYKLIATKQGDFNNYSTSSWSMTARALSEVEQIAIEQHGQIDLKTLLGKRPDADGLAMIKAMFLDSLAGKPFDHDSYGAFYRPYNKDRSGAAPEREDDDAARATPVSSRSQTALAEDVATAEAGLTAPSAGAAKSGASDIMEKLRSRTQGR